MTDQSPSRRPTVADSVALAGSSPSYIAQDRNVRAQTLARNVVDLMKIAAGRASEPTTDNDTRATNSITRVLLVVAGEEVGEEHATSLVVASTPNRGFEAVEKALNNLDDQTVRQGGGSEG